jgi:hypothetical protein
MQCTGCEQLREKEFNLCWSCYQKPMTQKEHLELVTDGRTFQDKNNPDFNKFWEHHSVIHHTGTRYLPGPKKACSSPTAHQSIAFRCPSCQNCLICKLCICHNQFQMRFRFFDKNQLTRIIPDLKTAMQQE